MASTLEIIINKPESLDRLIGWAKWKFDTDPQSPMTNAEIKAELEFWMRRNIIDTVLKWERDTAAQAAYSAVPGIDD